jgi:hypothetical protein
MAVKDQPLSKLTWVSPDELEPNDWNPNHVAPPELELLRDSILADGWTQPIVITADNQIVDGFHRYTLGLRDPNVRKLTGALVPCVPTLASGEQDWMSSTVRHNRARGTHAVALMAGIVRRMKDEKGMSDEQIADTMGMELEEVDRLYDRSGMTVRGARDGFSKGWVPGRKSG